jgi:hypothetical protein
MQEATIHNLGAYIKPEFRDITYFHGIDFHQDIIDWPAWPDEKKWHDFITLYVYIHDVDQHDSPLNVLIGSHKFGTSTFPHILEKTASNSWRYTDDKQRSMECEQRILTGNTGYVGIWNPYLLHGTQHIGEVKEMRLSLRYILARDPNAQSPIIDDVLAGVDGPFYIERARTDLNDKGIAVTKHGNIEAK